MVGQRSLTTGLDALERVHRLMFWPGADVDRIGVVGFTVAGVPAKLVTNYVAAEHGVGVRDGRFCARPLLARINGDATAVRASVGLGSRQPRRGR
jgi:selenocysteine lyase/cysteine desulfurase